MKNMKKWSENVNNYDKISMKIINTRVHTLNL